MSRRARVARLQWELRYGSIRDHISQNASNSDDEESLSDDDNRQDDECPVVPLPADEESPKITQVVDGLAISQSEREAPHLVRASNPMCGVVLSPDEYEDIESTDILPAQSSMSATTGNVDDEVTTNISIENSNECDELEPQPMRTPVTEAVVEESEV